MKKCFLRKIIQLLFIITIINYFTGYAISKPTPKILISSIENGTIKLFNLGDSTTYILNVSKKQKKFVWDGISSGNWKPYIETVDLNKDGKKEIIVHIVIAEGTNCYAEEIHIIDLNSLSEIKIENPLSIVKNYVKTQINKKYIKININGKNLMLKNKANPLIKQYFKNIIFDDSICYIIKNNSLIAKLGAKSNTLTIVGYVYVEYTFKNETIKFKRLYFKPN